MEERAGCGRRKGRGRGAEELKYGEREAEDGDVSENYKLRSKNQYSMSIKHGGARDAGPSEARSAVSYIICLMLFVLFVVYANFTAY